MNVEVKKLLNAIYGTEATEEINSTAAFLSSASFAALCRSMCRQHVREVDKCANCRRCCDCLGETLPCSKLACELGYAEVVVVWHYRMIFSDMSFTWALPRYCPAGVWAQLRIKKGAKLVGYVNFVRDLKEFSDQIKTTIAYYYATNGEMKNGK